MSDNLIRCVHENGKVCFLTKKDSENRAFLKKYGIRVEHVNKELPKAPIEIIETECSPEIQEEVNREAEAALLEHQIDAALTEANKPVKPKQTRKPRKPTKNE